MLVAKPIVGTTNAARFSEPPTTKTNIIAKPVKSVVEEQTANNLFGSYTLIWASFLNFLF
jgi:hypothetical protein